MNDFLLKIFIKDYHNTANPKIREQYGVLGGITGIVSNLCLFAGKYTVGVAAQSVSIQGDAVNNLSDAISSIITLVSFKLSGKPPDEKHPFGHARAEYIASSAVALIIIMIGWELFKTSLDKVLRPSVIEFSWIAFGALIISIAVKLWLYRLNKRWGQLINSSVMQATATDSLSDVMSTAAVLAAAIVSALTNFQLDGYMGLIVAILIIISGIKIIKETINSILGPAPSQELIQQIQQCINNYEGVQGIHDLVVHDYGPNKCFASVHVEVDAKINIMESHDMIDNIERDAAHDLGVTLVIHMDPVLINDPMVSELYQITLKEVQAVDASLSIHDFRIVKGVTHSNLIFDVTVPYNCSKKDSQITGAIKERISNIDPTWHVVITLDRLYVSY